MLEMKERKPMKAKPMKDIIIHCLSGRHSDAMVIGRMIKVGHRKL